MKCTKDLFADFCNKGITEEELQFAKSRTIGSNYIAINDVTELKHLCIDEIVNVRVYIMTC
jgi:hypothetical protein